MKPTNLSRRHAMLRAGGAISLASIGTLTPITKALAASESKGAPTLPEYAAWKNPDALIIHSANTMETKRSAFGDGLITPLDRLFVRNNLNPPPEEITHDPDSWEIRIEGVKNPTTFTVGELKRMGLESVPMILQCSGNGRGYFPSEPSGTQWTVGAAGCIIFTGVPVKKLIEATGGIADGMKYMTSTGGEEIPEGIDPDTVKVERSVPAEISDRAILAWEINGVPLPLAHGGPLRLVVPGYTGVNSIKYVKQVAFTEDQSSANIQQNSYRMAPLGEKGNPEYDSVWEMPVKSWVTQPSEPDQKLKSGLVQIKGLAMGGNSDVTGVEVSVDGGETWHEAKFIGPDLGPYAWRQFVYPVELEPGKYEVTSRATNADGKTQPEERLENNRGYLNNSWHDHMLSITVT
ncbi:MAG TPA: molybdopterin-dependent oxidoreductase [Paenalcaligenes sp.]|nr:molybdopterin-dependent oxidoreductase [Paenalcaligenes sp.]